MEQDQLNGVANFIWGISDDVLRDLYERGKYPDVILPVTVLRPLDAVLEPTKQAVLEMKGALDEAGIANQDQALRQAAGQAFYNTSKFTLHDLKARASPQQLTGKLDVHEASARLPDESDEPKPIETIDVQPGADEATDELDAESAEAAV